MKKFFISALLGFVALGFVNLCSGYTGVLIPVSRFSIAVSGLLSVPGVTLLVLLRVLL